MFPKPGQVKKVRPPLKVFLDGREILDLKTKAGADEYQRRKLAMWERQGSRCILQITDICKQRKGRWPKDETTYDHFNGRGAGKQDDRILVPILNEEGNPKTGEDGKPLMKEQNAAVCWFCNSARGSRRIQYNSAP